MRSWIIALHFRSAIVSTVAITITNTSIRMTTVVQWLAEGNSAARKYATAIPTVIAPMMKAMAATTMSAFLKARFP